MSDTKRTFVKKIIKFIRDMNPLNNNHKIHIVFEACEKFHYFHMEPIIKRLINDDRYKITIVKWSNFNPSDQIPGINYITFNEFWHDWFSLYDMLITTELERRPDWFKSTAICMFHGAGPKMSYIKKPAINDYDVVFSVGPSTYKVQTAYAQSHVKIEAVGLPITDILVSDKKIPLPTSIHLDDNKPTLLYAPSWSLNHELISMNEEILDTLGEITDYNIIIRPHPNLLIPRRCNDVDWNPKLEALKTSRNIQISQSNDHSIYELLQQVDILLSDISSVTYEYLVFNKPIILYMKDGILDEFDASEFIEPLFSATTRLDKLENLKEIIKTSDNDELSNARKHLLDMTLFNVGSATDQAIDIIEKYAGH